MIELTNKQRIDKYIQEHCINCIHRDTNLCEIHIFAEENIIKTKCSNYERNENNNVKN